MKAASTFDCKHSAPSLHNLCSEVTAFSHQLLRARATLPRPGYHIDLEEKAVTEAVAFFSEMPSAAAKLAGRIQSYQKVRGKSDHLASALSVLKALSKDCFTLYRFDAPALHQALDLRAVMAGVKHQARQEVLCTLKEPKDEED